MNSINTLTWTLRTDDTAIVLTVSHNRPTLLELKHPQHAWNWTAVPSEFPLIERVELAGRHYSLDWVFQDAQVDDTDGYQVALRFTNIEPAIELKSIWRARGGPGPVEQWMTIQNKTGERILIHQQESLDLRLGIEETVQPKVWYVNKDAGSPFTTSYQVSGFGVYTDALVDRYTKEIWTQVDTGMNDTGFIPWTALDAGGQYGVYAGWACESGRVQVQGFGSEPLAAVIKAGLSPEFTTHLEDRQVFETPPAFIGTYLGDVDDGSNRLRKWLFNTSMPEINRSNKDFPNVSWNAFWNTGIEPNSWISEERNYYKMVDGLAEVGVEEVILDVGWWQEVGDWRPHAERWRSGLAQASAYAHSKGLRFGLYFWFRNGQSLHPQALSSRGPNGHPGWFVGGDHDYAQADLAVPECRQWIRARLNELFDEYGVDTFRTDMTPLSSSKASDDPHKGINDGGYWSEQGFWELLDSFYASRPGFKYLNCSGGGAMKAYGVMKRTAVIQTTDIYNAIDSRMAIYDSLYCYPAVQLMTIFGDHVSSGKLGTNSYRFRSYLYAAACAHIEHPGEMSKEDCQYLARLIATYKQKIRPLLRSGDVYHILPRPDGVHWDGIEYYDPATCKGVVMVFKPASQEDTQVIRLRGLDREQVYQVYFEDGTNPVVEAPGAELIDRGLLVRLAGNYVAEWIFFQPVA
jgi:alpha-galactosidase